MSARILIAEDEESILTSLEFLMRRSGFETRVARDGELAVGALHEFRPDLVLLDIMLPGRSGFEVCRAIRADPQLRATRVLMLTAKGGAGEISKAMAAGADDYMTKPFGTHELVARARALLEAPRPSAIAPSS
ncbi:MAG TPA: response regulator [Usitatibacter sp.]|nr:response regulator [Usitatibacter sp.]